MYREFTVILSVSIFLSTARSTFLPQKCYWPIIQWHLKWSNSNVTLVDERQQITWRYPQNIVSFRILYKFTHINLTLVICLTFVFIEMLDKLITWIVCWYNILYQVLSVAWTNRITTCANSQGCCFTQEPYDMTTWQNSSAVKILCNITLFSYHHSVVIQHLLSDSLRFLIFKGKRT